MLTLMSLKIVWVTNQTKNRAKLNSSNLKQYKIPNLNLLQEPLNNAKYNSTNLSNSNNQQSIRSSRCFPKTRSFQIANMILKLENTVF